MADMDMRDGGSGPVPAWYHGGDLWIGRPDSWPVIQDDGETFPEAVSKTLRSAGITIDDLEFADPLDSHRFRNAMARL